MKKIIHLDMDAFYASIEQRDNPAYQGQPVIVGGDPNKRGVVSTCSYEARKFGINSAMSSKRAYLLCPRAIFVRPRMAIYKEVSTEIKNIFYQYTNLVEPLSLDEAFLDVTTNKPHNPSATLIAQEIQAKIYQKTKLTASAGVSYNKFLAKVASDYKKPKGLTIIKPEEALDFIKKLPIRKFFGIGAKTEEKMLNLGINTGADLIHFTKNELVDLFGKPGAFYYNIVRGFDHREVNPYRLRKSLGKEITLEKDIDDPKEILEILTEIAYQVETSLAKNNLKGKTLTLKIKFHDFTSLTRSITILTHIQKINQMVPEIKKLLNKIDMGEKKVRLLGITISNFEDRISLAKGQLLLPFDT